MTRQDNAEHTIRASATVGDNTYTAVKSGEEYKITIPNISAHQIGEMYEITVKVDDTDFTFRVQVSALSYVKTVLEKTETDAETNAWKLAVAAFYSYYAATVPFLG